MFEFAKGMICILDTGIGQKVAGTDKWERLDAGAPVKIVEIMEPSCSSMVSGECQAPCKGACCPRSIIVEDYNGKQWTIKPDFEEDDDGDFPLIALEDRDVETLLTRKDWKKFKLAKWTDEGIESKYKGPLYVMVGVMCMSTANNVPGPWGFVLSIISGLVAIYGATNFVAGNKYAQHPLPYGQVIFYRNYEKNKAELKVLLDKSLNSPEAGS